METASMETASMETASMETASMETAKAESLTDSQMTIMSLLSGNQGLSSSSLWDKLKGNYEERVDLARDMHFLLKSKFLVKVGELYGILKDSSFYNQGVLERTPIIGKLVLILYSFRRDKGFTLEELLELTGDKEYGILRVLSRLVKTEYLVQESKHYKWASNISYPFAVFNPVLDKKLLSLIDFTDV